jgi:hypothetical protein
VGRHRILSVRSVSLPVLPSRSLFELLSLFLIIPLFHADCRPPIETIATLYTRGSGDPPSDAVLKVASVAQGLQASDSSMKLPKALCGRVANVVIWEDQHWARIKEHAPIGTFIRLRNVGVRRHQQNGFRCKSTSMSPSSMNMHILPIASGLSHPFPSNSSCLQSN